MVKASEEAEPDEVKGEEAAEAKDKQTDGPPPSPADMAMPGCSRS